MLDDEVEVTHRLLFQRTVDEQHLDVVLQAMVDDDELVELTDVNECLSLDT